MRWWILLAATAGAAACGEEFTSFPGEGGAGAGAGGDAGNGGIGGGDGGTGGDPDCHDDDQDGVTDCDGDCDDADPLIYPGAQEICGDGIANACEGKGDPAACMGQGSFVSKLFGDDDNPGTQEEPVETINEGINRAAMLGQPVFVAEGTYPEDITLVDGIALLGGHHCVASGDCGWERASQTYVTTIESQDPNGIYAGAAIGRDTLVEGFVVKGADGNGQQSAFIVQGAPTIRGNHILGVNQSGCSGCRSHAIIVSGAPMGPDGVLIEDNVIDGGDSSGASTAIAIDDNGRAVILANDIRGGTARITRAVAVAGDADEVVISGNDLHAGSCNAADASSFAIAIGPEVAVVVDANRINADAMLRGSCAVFSGEWWTGGIESMGSAAVITNNVVFGNDSEKSAAVLLADCEGNECDAGEVVLNGNTLDGLGAPAGGASFSAALVFKGWKAGEHIALARVRNNILIGGASDNSFGAIEDTQVATAMAFPQKFDNNDLVSAETLYLLWNGAVSVPLYTASFVDAQVNGAEGTMSIDPELDATFHLAPTSPCIDAGIDNEAPDFDIDGDARPEGDGVDVGADEAG
jgi:hypothetical protein